MNCVVQEKMHTHPMKGHQEGRGNLKSENFRSKV